MSRVAFLPSEVLEACGQDVPVETVIENISKVNDVNTSKPPAEVTAIVNEIEEEFPGLKAFEFDLKKPVAEGQQKSFFYRVNFTSPAGVKGPLGLKVQNESLSGGVKPLLPADAAAMSKSRSKFGAGTVEARQSDPSKPGSKPMLQFTVYKARLDDAAEVPEGTPVSEFVHAMAWFNLAFLTEIAKRVARGSRLAAWHAARVKDLKAAANAELSPADLAAATAIAFEGEASPPAQLTPNCAISTAAKAFNPTISKFVLRITMDKIATCIQTIVRQGASSGMSLKNPILRVGMDLVSSPEKGLRTLVLDKEVPVITKKDGKNIVTYAPALVAYPGAKTKPAVVSDETAHLLFCAGAVIEGIIDASSVCFSSQGVSTPIKARLVTVTRRGASKTSEDDMYGDNVVTDEEAAAILAAASARRAADDAEPSSSSARRAADDAEPSAFAADDADFQEVVDLNILNE